MAREGRHGEGVNDTEYYGPRQAPHPTKLTLKQKDKAWLKACLEEYTSDIRCEIPDPTFYALPHALFFHSPSCKVNFLFLPLPSAWFQTARSVDVCQHLPSYPIITIP